MLRFILILHLISFGIISQSYAGHPVNLSFEEKTAFSIQEDGKSLPSDGILVYSVPNGISLSGSEITGPVTSFKQKHESTSAFDLASKDEALRKFFAYRSHSKALFLQFQSTDIIFPFHFFT